MMCLYLGILYIVTKSGFINHVILWKQDSQDPRGNIFSLIKNQSLESQTFGKFFSFWKVKN